MSGLQQAWLVALLIAGLAGIGCATALMRNADRWSNDKKRRASRAVIYLLAVMILLGIASAVTRWR